MGNYSLTELVMLTGIRAATIRIWERRYNILKPHRTKTNRRFYDDDDLRDLLNINSLYRNGLKISKIAALSSSEIEEKVNNLSTNYTTYDTSIDSMIAAMISFNKSAINQILLRSIINKGFEDTIIGLVFPFLKRVGVLWQTGNLNIGAEHFISNIFRSRLISTIDSLTPEDNPNKKRVILYLPEQELHELSLLFYKYIIVKMGHEVIYLGQATPIDSVIEVNEKWHSDIIVTGLISGMSISKVENYLNDLSKHFAIQKILVAGLLAVDTNKITYPNIFSLKTVNDLKSHLI